MFHFRELEKHLADARKKAETERPASGFNTTEIPTENYDELNVTGGSRVRFQDDDDGHDGRRSLRMSVEVNEYDDPG